MRMVGIVLLVVGISYTKQTHDAKIGPLDISVSEKQQVNVPVWAGIVMVVVGGGLLVSGRK